MRHLAFQGFPLPLRHITASEKPIREMFLNKRKDRERSGRKQRWRCREREGKTCIKTEKDSGRESDAELHSDCEKKSR